VIDAIAGKIKMDETAKGRARTAWVTVLMNYATGETLKYLGGLRFQKTEGTKDFGLLGKDTMNGNMVLPEGCLIRTEEDAMVESDRFFDLISAIIRDRKRGVVAKVQALTTLMDFSQGEALEYFSHLRGVIIKNNRDIFRRQ
jgi:hypothetical protein